MRFAVILTFFASLDAQADSKGDLKKLEGTWEIVQVVFNGWEPPESKGDRFSIKSGKMAGHLYPGATVIVDTGKSPNRIDVRYPHNGKSCTVPGIYEFIGEELRMCFAATIDGIPENAPRPTGFDTEHKVEVFFRAKRVK